MFLDSPSLLYDIPRSLPLAVGLPILAGAFSGKITASTVKVVHAMLLERFSMGRLIVLCSDLVSYATSGGFDNLTQYEDAWLMVLTSLHLVPRRDGYSL